MWYVIQTRTGQEKKIKSIIDRTMPKTVYNECRILYYEAKRKYEGQWHLEKRTLFPGYLFIESSDVENLYLQLRKISELTKLLRYGQEVVAITKEEEDFLREITKGEDTVEMSYGFQDGDHVVVRKGCLAGRESMIHKIDRHKRKVFIEVELLGIPRMVEIGLEIVEKKR